MNRDEKEIRDLVAGWMVATRKGEWDKIHRLIDDDALFFTAGQEPMTKQQFADASGMENVQIDGHSDIQEIEIIGDRAWIRTHLEVTVTTPTGRTERSGYTLTILRKNADGKWVLYRDANLFGSGA